MWKVPETLEFECLGPQGVPEAVDEPDETFVVGVHEVVELRVFPDADWGIVDGADEATPRDDDLEGAEGTRAESASVARRMTDDVGEHPVEGWYGGDLDVVRDFDRDGRPLHEGAQVRRPEDVQKLGGREKGQKRGYGVCRTHR